MKKMLLLIAAIGLVLSGCGTVENGKTALSEKSEATSTPKTVTTTGKAADVEWEAEIKEIAGAALSPTEKADKTESLARTYSKSVADDELKVFESFIVEEYKNGNYLKDIKNDSYMLTNIFKSVVIEKHYDDAKATPIDRFAFDFYQNTKYTYRGADAVDSDSVKSNEEQMDKSLSKIK